jgi:regulator of sigma E protease
VRVEIFSLGFALGIPRLVLWKRTWGETEYRICAVPFGGYVKMAGETLVDLERKGDPGELMSKTPWQRFQIFVAGATMNLLIAFPIAIAAYLIGMYESPNQVGRPGLAEARSGIRPGDEIIEVDGRPIQSLDKFRIEMVRRQSGATVPVTVLRNGKKEVITVTAMKGAYHQTLPAGLAVGGIRKDSPLAAAGVQERDEIISVNGERLFSGHEVDARLRASAGKDVRLSFRRRSPDFNDSKRIDVTVPLKPKDWYVIPTDDNLFECIVGSVAPGMPATEVLEPGDVIKRIGDKEIACWQDLKDVVENSFDVPLKFTILRKEERREFEIRPSLRDDGKGAIGIMQKFTNVFARVMPGSYYDRAGLKSGDVLVSMDGVEDKVTLGGNKTHPGFLGARSAKPRTVVLQVKRKGTLEKIELVAEKRTEADLAEVGFDVFPRGGELVIGDAKTYRHRSFGEALSAGVREPYDLVIMTFDVLRKLVTGGESAKGLSGPVGIFQASYSFAKLSLGNFLWLLCLITVNLGVFNLLPIPVLDGGHNVLLLIEVVRKKFGKPPPSEKFIAAFQYTGLILILALFLYVTYNDFTR